MEGEQAAAANAAKKDEGQSRQRSTIAFPYSDLNSAQELANAIHSHVGTGDCDDDQLAAWTSQSVKSSGFRTQIYAARMFGILEGDGGRHRLTELGRAIVDPNRMREARVRAFLTVPLYQALYENHRGTVIPPTAALERVIVGLGVAEKQKDRARQVFERSAEQAGFFEQGRNRLVRPGVAVREEADAPKSETPSEEKTLEKKGGGGGGEIGDLHPFVQGLLKTLPPPETDWPSAARVKWLQTAANIFDLIYSGEGGGIVVTAARADRSPRPHEHD